MRSIRLDSLVPGPTLIARAYDAILGAICDGRLPPGARLNQDALAEKLGISRQPVGQALSILRAQGFARDTGRRSLIVAPLEREFFCALYQLREALDPMAAQHVAQRASPDDIAEGRRLVARGRKAAASGSVRELISADMDFHLWLYRTADNPLLVQTMVVYWHHLRRAMGEVLQRRAEARRVWDEHAVIVEGIARHDERAASSLALAHVRGAADRVAGSIPAAQHAGSAPERRGAAARRQ